MTGNTYSPSDDAAGDGPADGNPGEGQTEENPSIAPDDNVRDLADIPAIEVITKAIVMLMSASAEKLGLAEGAADSAVDLDEARRLITALAGLIDASRADLGIHAAPIRDGLKQLQLAFREASAYPDEPGEGPGEKYTGPVRDRRR
ncbi:DUF1844 domain-containing protein [Gordonia sp. DT30]|uniref:DUF1844 domain-containing protein n=1 Tax=unclassified Gordonia (in: high G+C Gram-positive bacteria) TaxID=2657482 RepID=UPI003CF13897